MCTQLLSVCVHQAYIWRNRAKCDSVQRQLVGKGSGGELLVISIESLGEAWILQRPSAKY